MVADSKPTVQTLPLGPLQTNAYLVYTAGDAVIVDPGDDPPRVLAAIESCGAPLRAILLTHAHFDHIGAIDAVKAAHGVETYVHEAEAAALADPEQNLSAFYSDGSIAAVPPERTFRDGDLLAFGSLRFEVRHTPGHSPGGCVLYMPDHGLALAGDAIFQGSVGRTDFPGASHRRLVEGLWAKVFTLPDATVLYPGHGPATTVGIERANNPYLDPDLFG